MYEPIKKLGQNFLNDKSIVQVMADALSVQHGADVIEIGSGLGIVTEMLIQKTRSMAVQIYAVEIDTRLIPKLTEMFLMDYDVHIVNEDILRYLPVFETTKPVYVIGSLPFYITSPIVHAIIKMKTQPEGVVLLVQKEVAQKIAAPAPDGSYMSVFVQSFYDVRYIQDVPRTKFNPVPEVDGAIISLTKKPASLPDYSLQAIEKYEGFLHHAFRSPRKMLNKVFNKDELAKMDVNPNQRPQELSADKWLSAYKTLKL